VTTQINAFGKLKLMICAMTSLWQNELAFRERRQRAKVTLPCPLSLDPALSYDGAEPGNKKSMAAEEADEA
jgi:hypothetical protein